MFQTFKRSQLSRSQLSVITLSLALSVVSGCGYISSGGEYSLKEGSPVLAKAEKTSKPKIPSYADQLRQANKVEKAPVRKTTVVASNDLLTGSAPSSEPFNPALPPQERASVDSGLQRGKLAEPFNPKVIEEAPVVKRVPVATEPTRIEANESFEVVKAEPVKTVKADNALPPAKQVADESTETILPVESAPEVEMVSKAEKTEAVVKPAVDSKLPSAKVTDDLSETEAAEKKVVEAQKTKLSPSVVATAARASTEGDCGKAEGEAERARTSVSEADQLFYYRRALRLCPNSPQFHLEIGKIYTTLGRKQDAEFEFRQVMELDPKNTEAKSMLSSLSK